MFAIPPDDAEIFRRQLKSDDIPAQYLRPYQMLKYMLDQEGHTGPLGALAVVQCLLSAGFKPELPDARPNAINWDHIKLGARLEAKYGEEWLAGEFVFFGQHKVACIRLDRNGEVEEFPRFNCRLPQGNAAKAPEKPQAPPEPETVDVFDTMPATDWAEVSVNEEVMVTLEGDDFTGSFVRVANDGQLVVLVEGEEHTVGINNVTRAAPAAA